MKNSKKIPAGATVYYCRRGLDYRYPTLMKVEAAKVKSRTPLGYKFECNHSKLGWLHLDEQYYISEDREEVANAVRKDIQAAREELDRMAAELVKAREGLAHG